MEEENEDIIDEEDFDISEDEYNNYEDASNDNIEIEEDEEIIDEKSNTQDVSISNDENNSSEFVSLTIHPEIQSQDASNSNAEEKVSYTEPSLSPLHLDNSPDDKSLSVIETSFHTNHLDTDIPLTKLESTLLDSEIKDEEEFAVFEESQDNSETSNEALEKTNYPDSINQDSETESHVPHEPELVGATPPPDIKPIEISMTKELRGLLQGYPAYINFENKEDTISLIKDIILVYKLLYYCETKSTKEDIKIRLKTMRTNLDNKGVPTLIEYYNEYISRNMNFGMSRVRRRLDVFVSININFLMETIQYFLFVMPFKNKKDMHFDTAHGLAGNTAEDVERGEIEKGEAITNLEGPWKIDDEGTVIPA